MHIGLEKSGLGLIGEIMEGLGGGASAHDEAGNVGVEAAYKADVTAAHTYYQGVNDAKEFARGEAAGRLLHYCFTALLH
jgi:hypothetical protein